MSKRDPKLLLDDILEAIEKIQRYTNGISIEDFFEDSKTQDAVIRNFEIIGEAAIGFRKNLNINIRRLTGLELSDSETE